MFLLFTVEFGFFSKIFYFLSLKKHSIVTPPNSPINFVPDTPIITPNNSMQVYESPIPDTPVTPVRACKLDDTQCKVTPVSLVFCSRELSFVILVSMFVTF